MAKILADRDIRKLLGKVLLNAGEDLLRNPVKQPTGAGRG